MSRPLLCGIAATLCFAGGAAAALIFRQTEPVCTAVNASGVRVVIGTELTPEGQAYKRENPLDDNNALLASLGGLGPELAWTRESIARCRLRLDLSGGARLPLLLLGVALAVAAVLPRRARPARRRKEPVVFISYSHDDAAAATRLRQFLESQGISVLIDSEAMAAGDRIRDFIARSIRDSDVVVSIVSSRSLLSAWVALESIQALQRNQWLEGGRYIACYLDDAFFSPESRLDFTRQIDERLQRIEELIPAYADRRIDTVDLNDEKTRLYDLRNNLGVILATLKECLCLDVRDAAFEESAKRLAAAIRSSTRRQAASG